VSWLGGEGACWLVWFSSFSALSADIMKTDQGKKDIDIYVRFTSEELYSRE
jgi:hypothetical protein